MRQRITKKFSSMFFIELKLIANNKDIYDITFLQCEIKFQQSRKTRNAAMF